MRTKLSPSAMPMLLAHVLREASHNIPSCKHFCPQGIDSPNSLIYGIGGTGQMKWCFIDANKVVIFNYVSTSLYLKTVPWHWTPKQREAELMGREEFISQGQRKNWRWIWSELLMYICYVIRFHLSFAKYIAKRIPKVIAPRNGWISTS